MRVLAHAYGHRVDGRIPLESKDALRSRLARSPDLLDALCYPVGTKDDGRVRPRRRLAHPRLPGLSVTPRGPWTLFRDRLTGLEAHGSPSARS